MPMAVGYSFPPAPVSPHPPSNIPRSRLSGGKSKAQVMSGDKSKLKLWLTVATYNMEMKSSTFADENEKFD